ncbi:GTP cyclohydrolase [Oxalobacteraceae bacterium OM1]|nr:GTP cyclohydrolase [Oxalobacteraceae bacterium OM1]
MLYLIILRYRAPLAEVDRHVDAHRTWLHAHYAAGHFLLSGPLDPREGGAILARAEAKSDVLAWIADDPFDRAGIADYDVLAWRAVLRSAGVPAALAPEAMEAR